VLSLRVGSSASAASFAPPAQLEERPALSANMLRGVSDHQLTCCGKAQPTDSECWVERESILDDGPRVIQLSEQCQGSGESEVR